MKYDFFYIEYEKEITETIFWEIIKKLEKIPFKIHSGWGLSYDNFKQQGFLRTNLEGQSCYFCIDNNPQTLEKRISFKEFLNSGISHPYSINDIVCFNTLNIPQIEFFKKIPELNKNYQINSIGQFDFKGYNGFCVHIEELYGGWIPCEVVSKREHIPKEEVHQTFKAKDGDKIKLLVNQINSGIDYKIGEILTVVEIPNQKLYIRASKNGKIGYDKGEYVLLSENEYELYISDNVYFWECISDSVPFTTKGRIYTSGNKYIFGWVRNDGREDTYGDSYDSMCKSFKPSTAEEYGKQILPTNSLENRVYPRTIQESEKTTIKEECYNNSPIHVMEIDPINIKYDLIKEEELFPVKSVQTELKTKKQKFLF